MTLRRKKIDFLRLVATLVLLIFLFLGCPLLHAASDSPDPNAGGNIESPAAGKPVEDAGPIEATAPDKTSDDEYGDVSEGQAGAEELGIADPIEPWNRAMHNVNDKLYFWLFKPTAKGYKYVVPEGFRNLFSSFYENLKAPIRIVNNFLQGKPGYAGIELAKFLINSTVGVGGLRDCAKECFGINGRDADFGQTLGRYGVGFGFYIVWPILGPSSPRDTVGWIGDWLLRPQSYVGSEWISPEGVGLYAHEKVNYTSFHIGDYEAIKGAAIDPYIAMRDAYVQYRKRLVEP
ncbi:MAG TPA: VacJ family lipoprotein [Syntrophorhabdus aromaticivorans]|nr:VacJ family lipoprotein [Syntrophorhabdus aromaticivorans]